jgi:hypothetical protein
MCQTSRVIAVGLVGRKRLERTVGLPALHADYGQTKLAQPVKQERRHSPRLEHDATATRRLGRRKGKVEIAPRLRMHQASICGALAEADPGGERVVTAGEGLFSSRQAVGSAVVSNKSRYDLREGDMRFREAVHCGPKSALRIARLGAMMAAAVTLAAAFGITSAAASTLVVKTTNGLVLGKTVGSVDQWLGIRYAASPAGVGRWKPPQPPGPYGTNHYNAT